MKKMIISLVMLLLVVSGCSANKEKAKEVDVKAVLADVLDTQDFALPATMEVDKTTLKDVYGIDEKDVQQYAIAFPMMNVQATEIILIEAKDGKIDTIKKALDTRMKNVEDTWASYLPEQYELVQNRKTFTKGNYTAIVIAEKADAISKTIKDALS